MPIFYIVPPRKTQLGEFGISISGILGIKTNLLNNAPITSVGALQLDQDFSPVWTSPHIFNDSVTFNDVVIFNGGQTFSINSLNVSGQALGDLIYFNGTNWTRFPKAATSGSILITNGSSIAWSKAVNVSTTITSSLTIGSLNGVLRASSGLVLGSSSINDLTDVLISSASNNQFLKFNSATSKWINSNIPLPDRSLIIRFLNGATPLVTGADQEIAIVPYEPSDGASILLFTVTRIVLQVENSASVGDSIVRIQKVNSNTAFPDPSDPSAVFLTELTLPAGDTEVFINRTDPLFDVYISSGQKLRLVIDSIGTGAEKWTVQLEATAGSLYTQPSGVVPISLGGTGRSTIGSSNTILAVSNSGDKLIYKQLVAGTSVSIVTTPISIGGIEVGGTITISSTGGPGGGSGTINSGDLGQIAYYSTTGTVISGASNFIWDNTFKTLSINTLPISFNTSSCLLLLGTSAFMGNANGTILAINTPASASFNGNFLDFQIDNTSKLTISYTGYLSASSALLSANVISTSISTGTLVVSGGVGVSGSLNLGNPLSVSNGGTGVTSATNGELLIGNASGAFTKNTIASGSGIVITNGNGTISIANNSFSQLNGLTTTIQTFAISTTGTDFAVTSSTSVHTFSLPDASLTARGVISTSSQSLTGLKTFVTGVKSQNFISNQDGYFGADGSVFTVGGTTAAIYFGILKDNALNRFAGMKVLEKQSPVHGAGYLYGDIVFYTDAEAQDFSTERLRIDGKGLITAANDLTINGTLTLPNHPLSVNYGGTGTSAFSISNGLISFNGSNFVSTGAATSGQILISTSSNSLAVWTPLNGDVTITGQGTSVIGNSKIQNQMLRDSVGNSVIGRNANSSGQPADIQANNDGNVLRLNGTTLGFGTINLASTNTVSGILQMSNGGTGLNTTSPGANYILGVNSSNNSLEYKQLVEGTNISIVHGANTITITSASGSGTSSINLGTPKQLAYYFNTGTVSSAAGIVFSDVANENLLTLTSQSTTSTPIKIEGALNQNSPLLTVSTFAPNKVFEIGSTGVISTGTWQASKIDVLYGGTGTSSFSSTYGIVFFTGGNLATINSGSTSQVLIGGGISTPSFGQVNLATMITGTLPLSNGGTGLNSTAPGANYLLGVNNANNELEYKQLIGTGVSIVHTANAISFAVAASGTGTVSSGTVNDLAYYSGSTTTASATGITYSATTTGTLLALTAQSSYLNPLKVSGILNQSAPLLLVQTSTPATVFQISSTGIINVGTWNASTIGIAFGGTNTSSFVTPSGLVYFNGSQLVTANTSASGIIATDASFVPFATTSIPAAVTIGGNYIYRASGTDIAIADGGTGTSSFSSTYGIVFFTGGNLATINSGSTSQVLIGGGISTPSFGQVNLSTMVTGTLPISQGGTNTSTFSTPSGLVYFNGTQLVTANTTALGIVATDNNRLPYTTTDVPASVTIGGSYIYRSNGTDIAISDGGTNTSSFNTPSGLVYYNGTQLVTANTSGLSIIATDSSFIPYATTSIPSSVNIGGSYIYRASGTDVSILDGGTGTSSFANIFGYVYYNGANFVTSNAATSGQILLSTSSNTAAIWTEINGDVTITGQGTTVIGASKVQNSMLRNSSANSIIGRSSNSSGVPADIQATANSSILRLEANTLSFGSINLSSSNAVTSILRITNGGTGTSAFVNTNGIIFYDGTDLLSTANVSYSTTNLSLSAYAPESGSTYEVRFKELSANGSNYVAIKAPDDISSNYSITLPSVITAPNQFLKTTDINGVTQWANINYSKSLSILTPQSTDKITLLHVDTSVIITKVVSVVRGSSPSSSWQLYHGTSRASGVAIFGSTQTTTSTGNGTILTSFSSSIISQNSFLWFELSTQTNVDEVHFTVSYN
jgi:hypothetical protein